MNTENKIQIKGQPEEILNCAYQSLLSLDSSKTKDLSNTINRIDKNFVFASTIIKPKIEAALYRFACLIYVKRIEENLCELTVMFDQIRLANYPGEGCNIILMSKFLQVFSENYREDTEDTGDGSMC